MDSKLRNSIVIILYCVINAFQFFCTNGLKTNIQTLVATIKLNTLQNAIDLILEVEKRKGQKNHAFNHFTKKNARNKG